MIEVQVLVELKVVVQKNKVFCFYIGMGYVGMDVLLVILCNMLENFGWYIVYMFYQVEILQGWLEMLFNFQQIVQDMMGMLVSNVLLLDEVIVVVEVMILVKCQSKNKGSNVFFVVDNVYLQMMDVVKICVEYFGFEVQMGSVDVIFEGVFGVLVQYFGIYGEVLNFVLIVEKVYIQGVVLIVVIDLLVCVLLIFFGE